MPAVGTFLLAAFAACWIALLLHELGHALAAWSVGVRLWGLRLGGGPVLWRGMVAGCRVHLALLPFAGAVQLLDADARAIGYRDIYSGRWRFEWGPEAWRAPIISLGGGFGNLFGLLVLVALWNLAGDLELGAFGNRFLMCSIAANLAGYLNLLPWYRSDGTHLLAHMRAARLKLDTVTSM